MGPSREDRSSQHRSSGPLRLQVSLVTHKDEVVAPSGAAGFSFVIPPARTPGRLPARVGIVSPQEVVEAGLRAMLERADGAWEMVCEQDGGAPPDVVLFDVLLLHDGDGSDLERLASQDGTVVIAVGRDLRPDLQARALELGARAAVSIGISGTELVAVIRSALDGTLCESPVARRLHRDLPLGSEAGLSRRESNVLRLIVQGYTNQEIAERLHLSINSIKTYIRTTYRKIGVGSRQRAITWAIQHGFPIDRDEPRETLTDEREPEV